jgi:hypothetical protein
MSKSKPIKVKIHYLIRMKIIPAKILLLSFFLKRILSKYQFSSTYIQKPIQLENIINIWISIERRKDIKRKNPQIMFNEIY